ncbi:hypothetical protein QQ045_022959 [Rhodiola kirilowii]
MTRKTATEDEHRRPPPKQPIQTPEKSDPYAVLAVRSQVKKSSVASGQGSDPTWNETLLSTITDDLEELSIKLMGKRIVRGSETKAPIVYLGNP